MAYKSSSKAISEKILSSTSSRIASSNGDTDGFSSNVISATGTKDYAVTVTHDIISIGSEETSFYSSSISAPWLSSLSSHSANFLSSSSVENLPIGETLRFGPSAPSATSTGVLKMSATYPPSSPTDEPSATENHYSSITSHSSTGEFATGLSDFGYTMPARSLPSPDRLLSGEKITSPTETTPLVSKTEKNGHSKVRSPSKDSLDSSESTTYFSGKHSKTVPAITATNIAVNHPSSESSYGHLIEDFKATSSFKFSDGMLSQTTNTTHLTTHSRGHEPFASPVINHASDEGPLSGSVNEASLTSGSSSISPDWAYATSTRKTQSHSYLTVDAASTMVPSHSMSHFRNQLIGNSVLLFKTSASSHEGTKVFSSTASLTTPTHTIELVNADGAASRSSMGILSVTLTSEFHSSVITLAPSHSGSKESISSGEYSVPTLQSVASGSDPQVSTGAFSNSYEGSASSLHFRSFWAGMIIITFAFI